MADAAQQLGGSFGMPITIPISPINVLPGIYSVFISQGSAGGLPVPDVTMVGAYARCSDLFGAGVQDLVLCQSYVIGGTTFYRWRPIRDSWPNVGVLTVSSALALVPLQSPTTIRLTGTLATAMTVTPSIANAYPGLTFDLRYDGLLSVLGISLAGVASATALTSGQTKTIYFDGTQFIQKAG